VPEALKPRKVSIEGYAPTEYLEKKAA
jgi:hypothetical protein